MGNSQSNDGGAPKSPASTTAPRREGSQSSRHREKQNNVPRKEPRRRESIPGLSHATSKSPAPPTATLVHSSSATTSQPPHATPSPSSHTRARSITATTPRLKPADSASSQRSETSDMGNQESRHRPPSRATTLPTPVPAEPQPSPSSKPIDMPVGSHRPPTDPFSPSGPPPEPYNLPQSNYSRPPRLPLPIEEEVHTPGSPIITPADLASPLDQDDAGPLPRRTSVLSSTTVDDDDIGDADTFDHYTNDEPGRKPLVLVPTTIEWNGHGDKIYVTGTFVKWERKFRLHRNKTGDKPRFCATINFEPGTHHLKFLVDGDMYTSDDLPTTVDYTNILVNYVEVMAPLPTVSEKQPPAPSEPMPIPGAAQTAGQSTGTADGAVRPSEIPVLDRPPETETDADLTSTLQETVSPRTQEESTSQGSKLVPTPSPQASLPRPVSAANQEATPRPKAKLPRPKYTNRIPDFLVDLDGYTDPPSERFQRATKVLHNLPQPPSLPVYLGKSVLNGSMPMKDDSSVLMIPNHTVLNHLATSSIKSGVLATSGTTRYKKKFLTTVMYKPTAD